MGTPYVGFGNKTLKDQPTRHAGDKVKCPHCDGWHILQPCDDGSEILLFYKCGDKLYLGAVANKLVVGVKSDCSGNL